LGRGGRQRGTIYTKGRRKRSDYHYLRKRLLAPFLRKRREGEAFRPQAAKKKEGDHLQEKERERKSVLLNKETRKGPPLRGKEGSTSAH